MRAFKNSLLSENGIKRLRSLVDPMTLEYYLQLKYWHEDKNVKEIGKEIGLSGSSVARLMKFLNVEIRTRKEQLKRLAYKNKRRSHTEQSKSNMSEAVKKSYTLELRKKRTDDNKRMWAKMNKAERKARTKPGLLAMHAIKWGEKRVF